MHFIAQGQFFLGVFSFQCCTICFVDDNNKVDVRLKSPFLNLNEILE